MATAAQGRSSSASSLKRVNKKVVSSRNSFSQRVNIPVLVATLGLVLYWYLGDLDRLAVHFKCLLSAPPGRCWLGSHPQHPCLED